MNPEQLIAIADGLDALMMRIVEAGPWSDYHTTLQTIINEERKYVRLFLEELNVK